MAPEFIPSRPVIWGKWMLRSTAIGLAAAASALVGAVVAVVLPLPAAIAPPQSNQFSLVDLWHQGFHYRITRPINILVMGLDLPLDLPDDKVADVFSGRSDVMMLVRIDPDTAAVNVLSIPRDTQVEMPEEGTVNLEKINYANVLGGPKLSAEVVSRTLNGITIDRYVRISTGAFRELVDLVGGVRVFVPERMEYVDNTQKLNIDLQPGWQTLNGLQAEQFSRFRHDDRGDIGRVQRQQQMIQALREQLTNPAMIARLPQAIQIFQRYIDTNLSSEELLALADFGSGLERDNFRMVMLPGRFSQPEEFQASYWLLDRAAADQVISDYFGVSSVAVLSQQDNLGNLKIAIQNASSHPQLGSQVAAYLQSKGFSNVYVVDDWPDPQTQTQVIVQRGDLQGATMLENVLGVGRVVSESTGDLDSDLTIRVGDDWAKRPQT